MSDEWKPCPGRYPDPGKYAPRDATRRCGLHEGHDGECRESTNERLSKAFKKAFVAGLNEDAAEYGYDDPKKGDS